MKKEYFVYLLSVVVRTLMSNSHYLVLLQLLYVRLVLPEDKNRAAELHLAQLYALRIAKIESLMNANACLSQ